MFLKFPRFLEINITSKCNLHCRYCFHRSSAGETEHELSFEEWDIFFQKLTNIGIFYLNISGGEPFFRKDFLQILESIEKHRMRFAILTNGTLITEKWASFLAVRKRCDFVQVSLDGATAEIHELSRGKNSFNKTIEGIKILKKYGIVTKVRVTIHKKNFKDLENIARFLLEELGFESFSTSQAEWLGLCQKNAHEMLLTVSEKSEAMEILIRLTQKYPHRIKASAGPLFEAWKWREMLDACKEKKAPFNCGGYLRGCGCFRSSLAVRADGKILACSLMNEYEVGDILNNSLIDIWQKSEKLNAFRKRTEIALSAFLECQDCLYTNYCTGGCPARSSSLDKIHTPNMNFCLKQFLKMGGKVPQKISEQEAICCKKI